MAFSEYPKAMSHPGYRPAVLSKDEYVNGRLVKAPPGSPVKFPPVYVNNYDQEQKYASEGYVPNGTSDPDAYYRATVGATEPSGHVFHEFPKWLFRPIAPGEVEHKLFKNQEEQDAIPEGQAWYATPGDAMDVSYEEPTAETQKTSLSDSDDAPGDADAPRGRGRPRKS